MSGKKPVRMAQQRHGEIPDRVVWKHQARRYLRQNAGSLASRGEIKDRQRGLNKCLPVCRADELQGALQELVPVVDREPGRVGPAVQARHAGGDQRGTRDGGGDRGVQGLRSLLPDLPEGGNLQLDGVHGW